jgi:hypothetical protein
MTTRAAGGKELLHRTARKAKSSFQFNREWLVAGDEWSVGSEVATNDR